MEDEMETNQEKEMDQEMEIDQEMDHGKEMDQEMEMEIDRETGKEIDQEIDQETRYYIEQCDYPLEQDTEFRVFDARRGLRVSAGGTISSRPAVDEADARYLDEQWALYEMENGLGEEEERVPPVVRGDDRKQTHSSDWEEEEEDGEFRSPFPLLGTTKRQGSVIKCHYVGCRDVINGPSLTCPGVIYSLAPDGESVVMTTEADFPHDFCSHGCMIAFALYEIGDPFADSIVERIQQRAGEKVVPRPCPVAMLNFKMGGLVTREEVGEDAAHVRRKGHKVGQ